MAQYNHGRRTPSNAKRHLYPIDSSPKFALGWSQPREESNPHPIPLSSHLCFIFFSRRPRNHLNKTVEKLLFRCEISKGCIQVSYHVGKEEGVPTWKEAHADTTRTLPNEWQRVSKTMRWSHSGHSIPSTSKPGTPVSELLLANATNRSRAFRTIAESRKPKLRRRYQREDGTKELRNLQHREHSASPRPWTGSHQTATQTYINTRQWTATHMYYSTVQDSFRRLLSWLLSHMEHTHTHARTRDNTNSHTTY